MTQYEQITQSPETLGAFLAALPVIHGPWDTEFQARFCADCLYLGCDACPHEEFRNNPRWWLTLEAGGDQAAEPLEIKITCPWTESGRVAGTIGEFRFRAKVYILLFSSSLKIGPLGCPCAAIGSAFYDYSVVDFSGYRPVRRQRVTRWPTPRFRV